MLGVLGVLGVLHAGSAGRQVSAACWDAMSAGRQVSSACRGRSKGMPARPLMVSCLLGPSWCQGALRLGSNRKESGCWSTL